MEQNLKFIIKNGKSDSNSNEDNNKYPTQNPDKYPWENSDQYPWEKPNPAPTQEPNGYTIMGPYRLDIKRKNNQYNYEI